MTNTTARTFEFSDIQGPYLYKPERMTDLIRAAADFLNRIDTITTQEFSLGRERAQREALRQLLGEIVSPT